MADPNAPPMPDSEDDEPPAAQPAAAEDDPNGLPPASPAEDQQEGEEDYEEDYEDEVEQPEDSEDPNAPPLAETPRKTPRSHDEADTTLLPSPGGDPDVDEGHISSPQWRDGAGGGLGGSQLSCCQRCMQGLWVCRERVMQRVSRFFVPAREEVNPELGLPTRTMMVSHMPFQVLLYYNRIYFVIWALLFATSTLWKRLRAETSDYYTNFIFALAVVLEACKLYMGFSGNLRERGFEMLAFFMLAIVEIGCTAYFLFGQFLIIPLDMAINILKLWFDVLGAVIGWSAMKRMIKSETTKFHVNQFVTNPTATPRNNLNNLTHRSINAGAIPN